MDSAVNSGPQPTDFLRAHLESTESICRVHPFVHTWVNPSMLRCGLRGWTRGVDSGCGLRVWTQGEDSGCGLRVWTQSVDSECGLRLWSQVWTRVWTRGVANPGDGSAPGLRSPPIDLPIPGDGSAPGLRSPPIVCWGSHSRDERSLEAVHLANLVLST